MYTIITSLSTKLDDFWNYLFPQNHSVSVHYSIFNSSLLFITRIISFLYLTGVYAWGISLDHSALNNIIYFTMIGYFCSWLFFLLVIQDHVINQFGKLGRSFPLAPNLKYYIQIIYEIAFCLQLPITAIFWGFLFKTVKQTAGIERILLNCNLHGGPLLVLGIDFLFNSFSFPRQHFIVILIISAIYGIINLIYTLNVHNIYPPITWKSWLSYVLLLLCVVMSLLMHLLGRYVFNKCKKQKMDKFIQQMIQKTEKHKEQKVTKTIKYNKKKQIIDNKNKQINKSQSIGSKQDVPNNQNPNEPNKRTLKESLLSMQQ